MLDGIHHFQIDSWRFVSLHDGQTVFDAHEFFPEVPAAERTAALGAYHIAENSLPVAINILVAISETQCVLVDTGLGQDIGNGEGRVLDLLAAAEIAPDEIDTVVITHGHWDHIGGLTDGAGRLNFPTAQHIMPRREWEFWTNENQLARLPEMLGSWARTHLPPLAKQIKLISADAQIGPGVRALPAPGHTPGHIGLVFEGEDGKLIHLADAFHHPLQLTHPSWEVSVDMFAQQAIESRHKLIDGPHRSGTHLFGYHFPFPGLVPA